MDASERGRRKGPEREEARPRGHFRVSYASELSQLEIGQLGFGVSTALGLGIDGCLLHRRAAGAPPTWEDRDGAKEMVQKSEQSTDVPLLSHECMLSYGRQYTHCVYDRIWCQMHCAASSKCSVI